MKNKLFYLLLFILTNILYTSSQTPSWTWVQYTTSFQGPTNNGGAIVADKDGYSYVTGGLGGPTYFGNILVNIPGTGSFYIVKYDSSGNVIWVRSASSTGNGSGANGIALDGIGNCYATGNFNDTIFFNNDTLITNGYTEIYVVKYDTSGNLLWLRKAGGDWDDLAYGIASDSLGDIYVTGVFKDTMRLGSDSLISRGKKDIFIAKYNTSGNLLWARSAGGTNDDVSESISIDIRNNCFITGTLSDTAIFGNDTVFGNNSTHIFIAKYDSSGNYDWVRTNGGLNQVIVDGRGISADKIGNCFVTGLFRDSLILGSDTVVAIFNRPVIFTAKFDSAGNEQWIRIAQAGHLNNSGYAITTDNSGDCFVTGWFSDTAAFGNNILISNGSMDIFVAKYDAAGNLQWVKKAGGNYQDYGYGISTDSYGNCYVTGTVSVYTAMFDSIALNGIQGQSMFDAKISCTGVQPEISFAGGILYSTDAITYQWFLNGTIINGATSQTYTPLQNGIYVVFTKDANGCGTSSIPFNLIGLGISKTENRNPIFVFPNPSSDIFNFSYSNAGDVIQKIEIQNLLGEKISVTTTKEIDLTKFPEGIYFYSVQTKKGKVLSGKILKQ